jgi:predicted transcriptional regulator
MSNKSLLIECVYSLELTQRATLVAFYLVNRADSEGTCFPGVKTIARECNISSRTVQRALNDLEEVGFLARESRFHEQGGQRSNLYYLQTIQGEKVDKLPNLENAKEVTNDSEVSDFEQDVKNIGVEYLLTNKADIPIIEFNDLCKGVLSRTPCQDGIP